MTREEAVARIKDHIEIHRYNERNAVRIFEALNMAIKALEQPEQRTGYWIKKSWHGENTRECSVCHVTQSVIVHEGKVMFKFCPYCGMKMMEGDAE